MINNHDLDAGKDLSEPAGFDDDAYLAAYAQVIRDAVVAAVDWMPAMCETPLDGGPSIFEKIVRSHLKGADRQIASDFLLNALAVIEMGPPSDWFDYVKELGEIEGCIASTHLASSAIH